MSGKRGPRSSEARVQGLLTMLPWLMQRTEVSIADMARQFSISEADLIEDIEMAAMCGVPPYTPFELTEVFIDGDKIIVGLNKMFERRLDLTSSEAFGLSLMAEAAQDIPGFSGSKELKSALKKLGKVLGEGIVDVDVESPEFLQQVVEATSSGERLMMTYWTPARNEESVRTITVRTVFTDRGHWYITADDDLSGDRRHFRVDRIRAIQPTGEFVPVVAENAEVPVWFADSDNATIATLDVGAHAAWVVETYPCIVVEERTDGSFQIQIAINSEHWLGRLLLRAGGEVRVVAPIELVGLQQATAAKVLASYANKI